MQEYRVDAKEIGWGFFVRLSLVLAVYLGFASLFLHHWSFSVCDSSDTSFLADPERQLFVFFIFTCTFAIAVGRMVITWYQQANEKITVHAHVITYHRPYTTLSFDSDDIESVDFQYDHKLLVSITINTQSHTPILLRNYSDFDALAAALQYLCGKKQMQPLPCTVYDGPREQPDNECRLL